MSRVNGYPLNKIIDERLPKAEGGGDETSSESEIHVTGSVTIKGNVIVKGK